MTTPTLPSNGTDFPHVGFSAQATPAWLTHRRPGVPPRTPPLPPAPRSTPTGAGGVFPWRWRLIHIKPNETFLNHLLWRFLSNPLLGASWQLKRPVLSKGQSWIQEPKPCPRPALVSGGDGPELVLGDRCHSARPAWPHGRRLRICAHVWDGTPVPWTVAP